MREPRKKPTFKPRKCAICGKEFIPNTYNAKYCSAECKYEAMKAWKLSVRREDLIELKQLIEHEQDTQGF